MTLGEQIRQKREEQNLSQEELAGQIGVSRQAVSKWESDRSVPAGVNRRLLCQVLSLESPGSDENGPAKRRRDFFAVSLGIGVILLILFVCGLLFLKKEADSNSDSSDSLILAVIRCL